MKLREKSFSGLFNKTADTKVGTLLSDDNRRSPAGAPVTIGAESELKHVSQLEGKAAASAPTLASVE